MTQPSLDGTNGFAQNLWDMLNDGGHWTVPRSGLIYRKEEEKRTFTLIFRMPWFDGLSVTAEELDEIQATEHGKIISMMEAAGFAVADHS